MKTTKPLRLAAVLLALAAAPFAAHAQAWPQKPVRLIVPFAAGGPSDALARAFARNLSDNIGQPVIVDNVRDTTNTPTPSQHRQPSICPRGSCLTCVTSLTPLKRPRRRI